MGKYSWSKLMFLTMLIMVLALAACGGGSSEETSEEEGSGDTGSEESTEEGSEEETEEGSEEGSEDSASGDVYNYEDFNQTVSNDGEASGEGTLNVGLTSDTPFEGTLNFNLYQGNPDFEVISLFDEPLMSMDEDFQYTNDGAMTYEVNEDDNTVTFTMQEGVTWHDGEPVTIDDYVYSYEVIGHPEYPGIRGATDGFTLIEGYDEYKSGDAEEISGIEVEDEYTATFTYTELAPSLTAGGFWAYAMPEHHYEGVEIADMAEAPQTRENPLGMGPYKVDSITPGEAVVMSKYEDYWRGEPNLDGVELTVVSPSSIANALETGEVDVAINFPTDQYPDVEGMEGVEWLANIEGAYTYIGFKLGEWNEDEGRVDYKPEEMKMGDKELRRAMWHAMDNDAVGERFYNGLRWKATSLITPYHANWHDDSLEVPEYDPEQANQILDEAGYEDTDGDGFRETPDGEPLEINFASMSGGDTAEPLANYYIQSWKDIGLNVQLTNGRLIEFNTFYDMVENDDPEVDIYQGAWGVGSDVDPYGLYGPDVPFNYPRYETEESTQLMEEGNSPDAFDVEQRQEIYNEWQALMVEEMPVVPTLYRSYVVPVNERVANYSIELGYNEETLPYNWGVTETE
ncbi:oligopeptide ABC transporter substrate-binding protein [Salinicoccus sp. RF5]|uniref:oligopeptide ABC transporter substrate-binding protein n=1 Tax=Salinicoccus sp. RF5 TaxID=2748874 RepID=UPI001E448F6E|nr:oligopeptide ABC transporter substrate-binding protein [Salinicoccus sp. RF5]MCC4722457.1 oligopeptide ABC transporter substrate-binding protein [Salinicoccus sp. RF5]